MTKEQALLLKELILQMLQAYVDYSLSCNVYTGEHAIATGNALDAYINLISE